MSNTNETRTIQVVSGDKPFDRPGALAKFLESSKGAISAALPSHLKPDRMLRLAVTEFSKSEKIRRCTGISILQSIVVASQLGLEPGIAGQGYLVPYGTTCQFVPGWQGIVGLLNNTGRATAWTGAAYVGDKFSYSIGSRPHIDHEPGENYGDPEHITHFYACGKVNGAEIPVIEVWTKARVEKHRDRFNKVGKAHYSFQHFEMYGRKVVLLQVLKYMPKSIELSTAMDVADANESNRFVKMDGDILLTDDAPEPTPGQEPETVVQTPTQSLPPPQTTAPVTTPPAGTPPSDDQQVTHEQAMADVHKLYSNAGISTEELTTWAIEKSFLRHGKNLPDLSLPRLQAMVKGWAAIQDEIIRFRSSTP